MYVRTVHTICRFSIPFVMALKKCYVLKHTIPDNTVLLHRIVIKFLLPGIVSGSNISFSTYVRYYRTIRPANSGSIIFLFSKKPWRYQYGTYSYTSGTYLGKILAGRWYHLIHLCMYISTILALYDYYVTVPFYSTY